MLNIQEYLSSLYPDTAANFGHVHIVVIGRHKKKNRDRLLLIIVLSCEINMKFRFIVPERNVFVIIC